MIEQNMDQVEVKLQNIVNHDTKSLWDCED
jgi:hypothetical protein